MADMETRRWQPIETAPKDATKIITFHGREMLGISYWGRSGRYNRAAWQTYSTTHSAWFSVDHIDQPTHWMPLPLPPEAEK